MTDTSLRGEIEALLYEDSECIYCGAFYPRHGDSGEGRPCRAEAVLLLLDRMLCCVIGYPEAGRKVCELPAGHEGYHQQGGVRWLGYHTNEAREAQPTAEDERARLLRWRNTLSVLSSIAVAEVVDEMDAALTAKEPK